MSEPELGGLFPAAQTSQPAAPYRVLARKYRPSTFAELIGQDALVRTLTNAFAQNRIAHAFMLTGVRGVGKTTTARIVARALNCIGPDGKGGPTITPCGRCDNCLAIAADRHVDVLEMDAASNNGVEDIRELIDGVRYAPGAARYKVYIIDEVHMLSKPAFNALLKTLEEPPPHVKFIFATTEIRKVPVTVLSRCQRFDLRRIDADVLIDHFNRIATAESVEVEPAAMAMIARAADGSARDGLSLLDQAIARGAGAVTAEQVRDMLGLADRAVVLDLYEAALGGDAKHALEILGRLHAAGADAAAIIDDLLDLTHLLTRLRLAPGAAGLRAGDLELQRGARPGRAAGHAGVDPLLAAIAQGDGRGADRAQPPCRRRDDRAAPGLCRRSSEPGRSGPAAGRRSAGGGSGTRSRLFPQARNRSAAWRFDNGAGPSTANASADRRKRRRAGGAVAR